MAASEASGPPVASIEELDRLTSGTTTALAGGVLLRHIVVCSHGGAGTADDAGAGVTLDRDGALAVLRGVDEVFAEKGLKEATGCGQRAAREADGDLPGFRIYGHGVPEGWSKDETKPGQRKGSTGVRPIGRGLERLPPATLLDRLAS